MEARPRVTLIMAIAGASGCDSLDGFAGKDAGAESSSAPTQVLGGQSFLTALAAGDGFLYYLTDTGQPGTFAPTEAVACGVASCLATRSKMADVVRPRAIALAPSYVYFSDLGPDTLNDPDLGAIFACDRPSCAGGARTLVGSLGAPTSMAITASGAIAWADSRHGSVEWCNDPCTTRHVLAQGQSGIVTIRAAGNTLYWTTSTEARRGDLGDASKVETLVANRGSALGDIQLHGGRLYWTLLDDPGGIESCDVADCAATTQTELSDVPTPRLLSVTSSAFVWTSPTDLSVRRCPFGACTPASATHVEPTPTNAALLAEDDASFYWATSDSASLIERLAK